MVGRAPDVLVPALSVLSVAGSKQQPRPDGVRRRGRVAFEPG